jgi:hypothetical protein
MNLQYKTLEFDYFWKLGQISIEAGALDIPTNWEMNELADEGHRLLCEDKQNYERLDQKAERAERRCKQRPSSASQLNPKGEIAKRLAGLTSLC